VLFNSLSRITIVFMNYDFQELPASVAAAATPAATAAISAAFTSATAASAFGPGFVDVESAPAHFVTVQTADCLIAFGVVGHLDKSKTAGLAGFAIRNDADAVDRTVRFKERADILLGGPEAEIAYKNVLH
jgi:hypothetical protein